MRSVRVLLALATAATAATAGGAAGTSRASAWVAMTPSFTTSAAVMTVAGGADGGLAPGFVLSWYVSGGISGGYVNPVADRGTVVSTGPAVTEQRRYAMTAGSTVVLTYGARVLAPSGVPHISCESTLWRQPTGTTLTVGSC